ncbi:hypothetical protein F3Y22_tig00111582pilonHSYRG00467 [Hibiscus syriacus]|uniref:RNase H type-1 domain-containing protein n=1 Tax=Hibiscus syriacus TaxID=106335 RepID=A0A6A2YDD8_HIBSY|nr:hypothetical protein F3Y22_tig00111582pilonHSYRG00467 [Hibiscus syriacus]
MPHVSSRTGTSEEKGLEEYKFDKMVIWIRIFNLTLGSIIKTVGFTLEGGIGTAIAIDIRVTEGNHGAFLRIRVAINRTKPLRRCVILGNPKGGKSNICPLKYDRLPNFCNFCGLIGHKMQSCNTNLMHQYLNFLMEIGPSTALSDPILMEDTTGMANLMLPTPDAQIGDEESNNSGELMDVISEPTSELNVVSHSTEEIQDILIEQNADEARRLTTKNIAEPLATITVNFATKNVAHDDQPIVPEVGKHKANSVARQLFTEPQDVTVPTKKKDTNTMGVNAAACIQKVAVAWQHSHGNALDKLKAVGFGLQDWQCDRVSSSYCIVTQTSELWAFLVKWLQKFGVLHGGEVGASAFIRQRGTLLGSIVPSLVDIAVEHFSELFSSSYPGSPDYILKVVDEVVTPAMNLALGKPFTEEEILNAFKDINPRKALGYDVAHGGLLVDSRIRAGGLGDGIFPMCHKVEETVVHALRDYWYAKDTLLFVGFTGVAVSYPAVSPVSWFETALAIMEDSRFMLSFGQTPHPSPKATKWRPPNLGVVKINVDGAFDSFSRMAVVGVVARDSSGHVLRGLAYASLGCGEAGLAEIHAFLAGLRLAQENSLTRGL